MDIIPQEEENQVGPSNNIDVISQLEEDEQYYSEELHSGLESEEDGEGKGERGMRWP